MEFMMCTVIYAEQLVSKLSNGTTIYFEYIYISHIGLNICKTYNSMF